MPLKWDDRTSYGRIDTDRAKGKIPPESWSAKAGSLVVFVSCGHLYHPAEWILTCEPFFREHVLGAKADMSVEQAQDKAVKLVRTAVKQAADALAPG